ncbi:MAG: hypothetical protein Q9222_001817 [Ikaeria aurantiellina]
MTAAEVDMKFPILKDDEFPILSLSFVHEDFQKWNSAWRANDASTKLEEQIHIASTGVKGRSIRNIAAFSIGTFQDARTIARSRSHVQLAALLTIKDALNASATQPVRCFIQDPLLTALDAEFLRFFGIEILHDPVCFCTIDQDTLVYAISANDFVYRKICEVRPWPRILVCDEIDIIMDTTRGNNEQYGSGLSAQQMQDLKDMLKPYMEEPLPEAEYNEVVIKSGPFSFLDSSSIYWRTYTAMEHRQYPEKLH